MPTYLTFRALPFNVARKHREISPRSPLAFQPARINKLSARRLAGGGAGREWKRPTGPRKGKARHAHIKRARAANEAAMCVRAPHYRIPACCLICAEKYSFVWLFFFSTPLFGCASVGSNSLERRIADSRKRVLSVRTSVGCVYPLAWANILNKGESGSPRPTVFI
jgi:hypothetical protein